MPALILGGAQFGMDYGATNSSGRITESEAEKILEEFGHYPDAMIDLAPTYGNAELRVGRALPKSVMICTKSDHVQPESNVGTVIEAFDRGMDKSLSYTGRDSLDVFLVHQSSLINKPWIGLVLDWLENQKKSGRVKKIGYSLYPDTKVTEQSLSRIDVLQKPINILDQSYKNKQFQRLIEEYGLEVQARSVFLQGVLLNPEAASVVVPDRILKAQQMIAKRARELSCSVHDFLVSFLKNQNFDHAIVGVTSYEEWKAIEKSWFNEPSQEFDSDEFDMSGDPWLSPTNWVLKAVHNCLNYVEVFDDD